MKAARSPVYGEINYDKVVAEIFNDMPGGRETKSNHSKDERKAMALLYRYQNDKAQAVAEDKDLKLRVQRFVCQLLNNAELSKDINFSDIESIATSDKKLSPKGSN